MARLRTTAACIWRGSGHRVFLQAGLIGRGLVDADDEDVRRRGDGPSHPEQPGESPIVFQRDAGGTYDSPTPTAAMSSPNVTTLRSQAMAATWSLAFSSPKPT